MENRDFKGVWIPREIWLNSELSMIEKGIFTEINSLDGENQCYASNEYLAEFCQCSIPTVTRAIKHLTELGLIEQVSFDGRSRVLKISNSCLPNQNDEADQSKRLTNNIVNNKNNTLSKDNVLYDAETFFSSDVSEEVPKKPKKKNLYQQCLDTIYEYTNDAKLTELLVQYLNLLLEKFRHEGKVLYANQWKGMLNKLDDICGNGECKYGEVVQQSITKGYTGFYPVSHYSSKPYVPDTNKAPQHKAGEKVRNEDGTLKEY